MSPKVAVIIVNWNSGPCLSKCLDRLAGQTVKPDQVIVVDNSLNIPLKEKSRPGLAIEIVRPPGNIGFAAANNLGVEKSPDADWIALLNPDAYPEPDWLAHLLEATRDHPHCDFFGSKLLCYDRPSTLDGVADVYHTCGLVWRHKHGRPCREFDDESKEIFSACAAAALYRKEAFLHVNGFDEDYFCYLEDVDLGFRLRLYGYHGMVVPTAVVFHVGSASTGDHSDFVLYHGHRNLVWTYVKNMPLPLFLFYLPQHLILNLGSLVWFGMRGRGDILLKAKRDAWKGLPAVWKKRRRVQGHRRVGSSSLRKFMARGASAVLKRRE